VIEALPAAVYTTDAEGRLTFYNEAAAKLWGSRPQLGESKFCGSWKLYWPDGTPLPLDQCPMAMALQQRRPIRGMEAVAERPDGTRVPFVPYPTPLFDASGRLTGAVNMLVDISERKRAEATLNERDAQFELASRIGQIGTYSYNYSTRILHLSPGCAAIYGLPGDTREITQKHWRAQVHPDDLPRIDAISRQALADRQPELVMEFRIIRPDDNIRWIESRILVTYNDAGRAVQMIGANIDVTARKQTEQDLAERNVQLALAEKISRVGSFVNDTKTDTIEFSAGYAAILGFPEGTSRVLRSQWRAIAHPEDVERADEIREQVFRQKRSEYNVDYRINLPGVGVRWIEARAHVSYEGHGHPRVVGVNIDVTERKRAVAALADSEARFRATFENAAVGVAQLGADGSIRRANASFARMLGYSVEELTTKTFQDLTHPDDLATNLSLLTKALVGETETYSIEKRYVRKDGGIVWASLSVGCVRKADGLVDYFVSVVQDITDRKRAEARLADRNAQFDLAGKIARIGSVLYDDRTRKLQLSPGSAAIYGLPEGTLEISHEDWRALVHPDDLPLLDAAARRTLTNGERECVAEFRIIRHGQVRWIESRVLISYDEAGRATRRIGANVDVTERKQAEQALAERNMQLALAARSGLVGSYAYDADTEIMQISEGYAAIHGFPEGTTEIARCECLAGVHPDDLARVEQLRSDAFRERRREYKAEYRIIRPGGELRWVETRCFITYDSEVCPHRVVGVSIDITERKRVEEQQRTLLAELDHRVKNALATVSAVVSHTRQGNRSVADFVAALDGRIRSMATTHELLSARQWHGVSLTELVRRELAPYAARNNTEIGGPDVTLRAEAGQVVSMVLHELATNAAKHGALSAQDGRVSVHWHGALNGNADGGIALDWQESGGPSVQAPEACGYGMEIIRDVIPYELGGRVDLSFPADGLCCRLEIPAQWLSNGTRSCGAVNGAEELLHGVP
jgi:PAS domain S-box-containing protein